MKSEWILGEMKKIRIFGDEYTEARLQRVATSIEILQQEQ